MSGHHKTLKNPSPNFWHLQGLLKRSGQQIAAGADAVYLSGKKFGARKFAQNFTDEEIEEAINFAHRRDVCVYVTINTLIHDRELAHIGKYLLWLYSIGVDAVLIQDTGRSSSRKKDCS